MHILKIVTHFGFIVIRRIVYAIIFSGYCVDIFREVPRWSLSVHLKILGSAKEFLAETCLLYSGFLASVFTPHSAALPASDSVV